MEHLDNLAIMNYLQGHGLSGGGLIGGYGTSEGYLANKGLKAYRDFMTYEKEKNKNSHQEALEKWRAHKLKKKLPKKTPKKTPKLVKDIINKQFKKIKKSNKVKDVKNKIDNFKNQMLEFSNVLKPKKVKKTNITVKDLRMEAKHKGIKLSHIVKGKRIQLNKKQLLDQIMEKYPDTRFI